MAANQSGELELLLIVILGGPGSGKTTLAACLGEEFPGLQVVSGGDLARLAVGDAAISRSPRLASLAKRLADRHHARQAALELNEVVTAATAAGTHSCPCHGLIVDGFRPADLPRLEQALSTSVTCILWLQCSHEVMTNRLLSRGVRSEDKRLGSAASEINPKGHGNANKRRVDAYLSREIEDSKELKALNSIVHRLNGAADQSAVRQAATSAMWRAAAHAGRRREWLLSEAQRTERVAAQIDWLEVLISITVDSGMVPKSKVATAETAPKASTTPDIISDFGLTQGEEPPPLAKPPVATAEVFGDKDWLAMASGTMLPSDSTASGFSGTEQWWQQHANARIGAGLDPINAVHVGDWSSYSGNFQMPYMEAGCWTSSGAPGPWWGGGEVSWQPFATAAPQWHDASLQEQQHGTTYAPGTSYSF